MLVISEEERPVRGLRPIRCSQRLVVLLQHVFVFHPNLGSVALSFWPVDPAWVERMKTLWHVSPSPPIIVVLGAAKEAVDGTPARYCQSEQCVHKGRRALAIEWSSPSFDIHIWRIAVKICFYVNMCLFKMIYWYQMFFFFTTASKDPVSILLSRNRWDHYVFEMRYIPGLHSTLTECLHSELNKCKFKELSLPSGNHHSVSVVYSHHKRRYTTDWNLRSKGQVLLLTQGCQGRDVYTGRLVCVLQCCVCYVLCGCLHSYMQFSVQ